MNWNNLTIRPTIFIFLFILLPLIYLPITQDPELSLRYFLLSLALTFTVVYSVIKSPKTKGLSINSGTMIAFGTYVLFTGLSLFKTINFSDGLYEFSKIVLCLIFLFVTQIFYQADKREHTFLPLWITIAAFTFSIVGIFQLFPLLKNSISGGLEFAITNDISSTLSNKNFFAETLLLALPFCIYTTIVHEKWTKWFAAITTILSFTMIVILQSASVYVAFLLAATGFIVLMIIFRKIFKTSKLAALYNPKMIALTMMIIISVPVLLVVIFPEKVNYVQLSRKWKAVQDYASDPGKIFEHNNQKNNNSVYDRLFLAKNSIEMAEENLLLGNGISNWKILHPKFGLYGNSFMSLGRLHFEHPHNDYLFILCESGLLGLLAWLAFLISLITAALREIKRNESTTVSLLMMFSIASVLSFMVTSMFGYPKERFFSMFLLLTSSVIVTDQSSLHSKKKYVPARFLMIAIAGVLCIISYIHFERYKSEIYLKNAFIYQKKSDFHSMQKMIEKAEHSFQIVDMTSTPLNWHLGQAFYYQGNHGKAFDCYLKASRENPYHMQVLNDLGALYEEQQNHQMAMDCFNRVFAINPDFPDTKMNMVALYFNTGEIDKAYELLRNHLYKYTPKWHKDMKTILFAKAEKLVQTTQDTALANLLNKRIQINPNYLMAVYSEAEKDSISFEHMLQHLNK